MRYGPLQNTTVGSTGSSSAIRSAISVWGMFTAPVMVPRSMYTGSRQIEHRPPGAQVLDHLELPNGAHPRSEADRLYHAPSRVDGEDPRLAVDGARCSRSKRRARRESSPNMQSLQQLHNCVLVLRYSNVS